MEDDGNEPVLTSILGPLEVSSRGRRATFRSSRERALMALLAARAPDAVPAPQLIEDLWGEHPPRGAATTLRAYISSLRVSLRALGAQDMVVTRSGGYGLSQDAFETLDARTFEDLIANAGRAHESVERAGLLGQALELWRGSPLPETDAAPSVLPVISRLEELRLLALERWAEARLELGKHEALSSELLDPCREHPLSERLWGARMLALYRSSRQAEALMAYRELSGNLRRELGLVPSLGLRELELAILRHDPLVSSPDGHRPGRRVRARRTDRLERDPDVSARPQADEQPMEGSALLPEQFVGRHGELQALRTAAIIARGGGTQIVLIGGEPGIGKSALVRQACEQLRALGASVLLGRCTSDREEPFQAWREALGRRASDSFGQERGRLSAGERQQARREHFEAIGELLERAGDGGLVVLALEDLHWAAPSTLDLLGHVARRIREARLLVILSARDERDGGGWGAAVDGLRGDPGLVELELDGLSRAEVSELLESHPLSEGPEHAAQLGELLHGATEGNPLFVRQMMAHMLVEPEAYRTPWGAKRGDLPLPVGLRAAIHRRIAALEASTVPVLERAAVIGSEFEIELLESSLAGGEALDALEQASRVRLLGELEDHPGRFRFAHELVRRALLDGLGPTRLARAHEQVARALEARGYNDGQTAMALAEHFAAAARPGHTDEAAQHALRAALEAIAALAFPEAAAVAERGLAALALDPLPDLAARARLLLALAEARLLSGDIAGCREAAVRAGEDARASADSIDLARAAVIGSYVNTDGQPDPRIVKLCVDALEALGNSEPDRAAEVLSGWADHTASSEGDAPRALTLTRRALAAATGRDRRARTRALFIHGEVLACGPDLAMRTTRAEELLELVARDEDLRGECDALQLRALARLEGGDLAAFEADAVRLADLAPRTGYWYPQMYTELWVGMRSLLHGELEKVEASAGRVLAFAAEEPNVLNLYAAQILILRREQGRLIELRPLLEEAVRVNPGIVTFRCASALLESLLGYGDRGASALRALTADRCTALPLDSTTATSLSLLAEVAAATCQPEPAASLEELLLPWSGLLVFAPKAAACLGAADRFLAMLAVTRGQRELARERFEAAVALESRVGSQPLLARTRIARERAGV